MIKKGRVVTTQRLRTCVPTLLKPFQCQWDYAVKVTIIGVIPQRSKICPKLHPSNSTEKVLLTKDRIWFSVFLHKPSTLICMTWRFILGDGPKPDILASQLKYIFISNKIIHCSELWGSSDLDPYFRCPSLGVSESRVLVLFIIETQSWLWVWSLDLGCWFWPISISDAIQLQFACLVNKYKLFQPKGFPSLRVQNESRTEMSKNWKACCTLLHPGTNPRSQW